MTTTEWLALWALIIAGGTLLIYLGQLVVLILVYRRVIKETDLNAKERRQEIEKAGDMMQAMAKDTERGLQKIANRNTVGLSVMGVCLMGLVMANRAMVRKFERNNTRDSRR